MKFKEYLNEDARFDAVSFMFNRKYINKEIPIDEFIKNTKKYIEGNYADPVELKDMKSTLMKRKKEGLAKKVQFVHMSELIQLW